MAPEEEKVVIVTNDEPKVVSESGQIVAAKPRRLQMQSPNVWRLTQHFAACPFCGRVHEPQPDAPRVTVDGRIRIVCDSCVSRMTTAAPAVPPKSNGEVR
jgi:hypothetical protein